MSVMSVMAVPINVAAVGNFSPIEPISCPKSQLPP